jgi:hypothetical protein
MIFNEIKELEWNVRQSRMKWNVTSALSMVNIGTIL